MCSFKNIRQFNWPVFQLLKKFDFYEVSGNQKRLYVNTSVSYWRSSLSLMGSCLKDQKKTVVAIFLLKVSPLPYPNSKMFFKWQLLSCQVLHNWKMPRDVLKIDWLIYLLIKRKCVLCLKTYWRLPVTGVSRKVKSSSHFFTPLVLALVSRVYVCFCVIWYIYNTDQSIFSFAGCILASFQVKTR